MRASKENCTRERWRRQAARLIVLADAVVLDDGSTNGALASGIGLRGHASHIANGGHFSVAKVRAYCERLVAEGERRAEEREMFIDWCRDFGAAPGERHSGPCNRHGPTSHRCDRGTPGCILRHAERGGWPLDLAGLWRARGLGSASAAVGPNIARTAQRLLDTLDGRCPWAPSAEAQPSKCDRCKGLGRTPTRADIKAGLGKPGMAVAYDATGCPVSVSCGPCRGTGHNLAGALPPIECSPAVHRKIHDSHLGHGFDAHPEAWTYGRDSEGTLLSPHPDGADTRTRVVPRGEHRMADDPNEPPGAFVGMRADVAGQGYEVGDRIRVRGYGYGRWAPRSTVRDRRAWVAHVGGKGPPESLMPRWRRGELRHAEQRRERGR